MHTLKIFFEIIIVNDGSNEETKNIAKYCLKHKDNSMYDIKKYKKRTFDEVE